MFFMYVSTEYVYVYVYIKIDEKVRRETAGESQSHNDLDGFSESENKRQKKTLKAMCFID